MFWISAEVGVFPVFVASEEMGRFIEGLGLLPHGANEENCKDDEEASGDDDSNAATEG